MQRTETGDVAGVRHWNLRPAGLVGVLYPRPVSLNVGTYPQDIRHPGVYNPNNSVSTTEY